MSQRAAPAPGIAVGGFRSTWDGFRRSLFSRLLAGFLIVSVPATAGRVLAASSPQLAVDVSGQQWLSAATQGYVLTSPRVEGGRVFWLAAAPIHASDGRLQGLVVANLKLDELGALVVELELEH